VYFSKEVPHTAAWSIASLRASKEMTQEPRSVHKVQANPFVGRHMLQPNSEGICASLDTDEGIWDAVARWDEHRQVTVAVVNITVPLADRINVGLVLSDTVGLLSLISLSLRHMTHETYRERARRARVSLDTITDQIYQVHKGDVI
jgi:hypothetical protein